MPNDRPTIGVSSNVKSKREYRNPRLIEHGSLRDITLSVGRSGQWDGSFGRRNRTAP